jgi:hypothetical protein
VHQGLCNLLPGVLQVSWQKTCPVPGVFVEANQDPERLFCMMLMSLFIFERCIYNIYIYIHINNMSTSWDNSQAWEVLTFQITWRDIRHLVVGGRFQSAEQRLLSEVSSEAGKSCHVQWGQWLQCYSQSIGLLSPKSKLEAQWLSTIIGSIYIYLVIQSQNIGHCEVVAPPDEPQGKRLPWPGIFLKWWDFRYFEMPRAKKLLKICL